MVVVLPHPGGHVLTRQRPSEEAGPLLEVCQHADVMPQLLRRPPPARRHAPLVHQTWTQPLHRGSSVLTTSRIAHREASMHPDAAWLCAEPS